MTLRSPITVFAPATVANVASGFDILGFAIAEPGDTVKVEYKKSSGVEIVVIEGDGGKLSKQADKNCASVVAQAVLNKAHITHGVTLSLYKGMALGSGLGSSAASSAAAAVATNLLLGSPLSKNELVICAMEGERLASGAAHADNVAPSILGGFIMVRSYNPLDIITVPTPGDLWYTVTHPHFELPTAHARAVVRRRVLLSKVVEQSSAIASLVLGLSQGDFDLIGKGLRDVIVEPARAPLVPCFYQVMKAATAAGALGASISGAGPSMFALTKGEEICKKVTSAMAAVLKESQVPFEQFSGQINRDGAHEVDAK